MYWHAVSSTTKWLKAITVANHLSWRFWVPRVPESFKTAEEAQHGSTRYTEVRSRVEAWVSEPPSPKGNVSADALALRVSYIFMRKPSETWNSANWWTTYKWVESDHGIPDISAPALIACAIKVSAKTAILLRRIRSDVKSPLALSTVTFPDPWQAFSQQILFLQSPTEML